MINSATNGTFIANSFWFISSRRLDKFSIGNDISNELLEVRLVIIFSNSYMYFELKLFISITTPESSARLHDNKVHNFNITHNLLKIV